MSRSVHNEAQGWFQGSVQIVPLEVVEAPGRCQGSVKSRVCPVGS